MSIAELPPVEADFLQTVIEATRSRKSWRERLQWLRDHFADPAFAPTPGQLASIAIYLRFLATGELRCEEDGRHFRPNHHAEDALQIETILERLSSPETSWILRRIYPYLPSWGDDFRRSEPLTRIRDIAHRNDIPQDLKREIKQRLQNKLHRCAGPEDLRTSEEILGRITSGSYSAAFVVEFQVFHAELQEFFNATSLEQRLRALDPGLDTAAASVVRAFLEAKAQDPLERLAKLTSLRQLLAGRMAHESPQRRSQLRLADIGLEDHAFTLLSECVNRLAGLHEPLAWAAFLRALPASLDNLRLSHVDPEECAVLHSELTAWAHSFAAADDFHLRRLMASLGRARRLAESYTERIQSLFPPRVEALGRALGIAEHALKLFCEGDIRGHVIFQLSRLVDLGLEAARQALHLPPWEAIVPGDAAGRLVRAADLDDVAAETGPLLLLLDQVDGDAEIPASIKGIILGHPLPHLSHLGVRARQARIPFASCLGREHLSAFENLVGTTVHLKVTPEGLALRECTAPVPLDQAGAPAITIPEAALVVTAPVLTLDQASSATCGAKAAGARRLLELAAHSGGLFRAPRGLAVPFGVLPQCLDGDRQRGREYRSLQERLAQASRAQQYDLLEQLRQLVTGLKVPAQIEQAVHDFFGPAARLAVRSSANGEDLEQLAGAGLYDSVINVPVAGAAAAIGQVWASLWTRRAALSRAQAGIPHEKICMAVLVQELLTPELSFILHTVNPLTGNHEEAVAEIAMGLGEVLASSPFPGTPYRLVCHRASGAAQLLRCASFSFALRPAPERGGVEQERLDYSRIALSADAGAAPQLGRRLAAIAGFLEERLGRPQDVEGGFVAGEAFVVQARPQQGL